MAKFLHSKYSASNTRRKTNFNVIKKSKKIKRLFRRLLLSTLIFLLQNAMMCCESSDLRLEIDKKKKSCHLGLINRINQLFLMFFFFYLVSLVRIEKQLLAARWSLISSLQNLTRNIKSHTLMIIIIIMATMRMILM